MPERHNVHRGAKMFRLWILPLLLLGVSGSTLSAPPASMATEQGPTDTITPVGAYHQHFMSPVIAEMWFKPLLPSVTLPEAFDQLLRRRAQAFGDIAALKALHTEDALYINSNRETGAAWITGQENVALGHRFDFTQPYDLKPVAYDIDGDTGHVAAYLTRGEGASIKHFAQAYLTLRKKQDGTWRISAEAVLPGATPPIPNGADALIKQLDYAGIQRGVVLSMAYVFGDSMSGDPRLLVPGHEAEEYAKVRAENDWTAAEVRRFPQRLIAFCGIDPLRPYALEEITRCHEHLKMPGVKLHFTNSGVDLRNAEHLARLAEVFRKANAFGMAIVAHIRPRAEFASHYGRPDVRNLLDHVISQAPNIPIQIAHMAGWGGYDDATDQALSVFAEAFAAKDPRVKNVIFDLTTTLTEHAAAETLELMVRRIRQIGPERFFWGTDGSDGKIWRVLKPWRTFQLMPLTRQELKTIANNVPPYLVKRKEQETRDR